MITKYHRRSICETLLLNTFGASVKWVWRSVWRVVSMPYIRFNLSPHNAEAKIRCCAIFETLLSVIQVSHDGAAIEKRFSKVLKWDIFRLTSRRQPLRYVITSSPPCLYPVHLVSGCIRLIMNTSDISHTELLRSTISQCPCLEIVCDTEYYIRLYYLKYSAFHNECEKHNDMQFSFHTHVM